MKKKRVNRSGALFKMCIKMVVMCAKRTNSSFLFVEGWRIVSWLTLNFIFFVFFWFIFFIPSLRSLFLPLFIYLFKLSVLRYFNSLTRLLLKMYHCALKCILSYYILVWLFIFFISIYSTFSRRLENIERKNEQKLKTSTANSISGWVVYI